MNLQQMQAAVRSMILDPDADTFDDTQITRFINLAVKHVADWGTMHNESAFAIRETFLAQGPNSFGAIIPLKRQVGGDYLPVKRILHAWCQTEWDDSSPNDPGTDTSLDIIEHVEAERYITGERQRFPKIMKLGSLDVQAGGPPLGGVAALEPEEGLIIVISFVPFIPDMTVGSDVPGTQGGPGIYGSRMMPVEYETAVITWAAILALNAENSDTRQWRETYALIQQGLLSGVNHDRATERRRR